MGSNTLPNNLSANSQNIKKFQLQQKGRNVLAVIFIVTPIIVGAIIFGIYSNLTSPTNSVETVDEFQAQPFSGNEFTEDPIANGASEAPSSSTSLPSDSTSPSNNSTPGSNPSTGGTSANNGGLPSGVTAAINSIEANGIKGSPYIDRNLDTSNLPDGTTIKFDRGSWSAFSPQSGSIKATATIYGQAYPGSITFSSASGTWKATGYSLESQ